MSWFYEFISSYWYIYWFSNKKNDKSSQNDDVKFCEDLARIVGVGAVPGSRFFKENVNHLIRFHFAKKDEILLAALDKLKDMKKKMPHY